MGAVGPGGLGDAELEAGVAGVGIAGLRLGSRRLRPCSPQHPHAMRPKGANLGADGGRSGSRWRGCGGRSGDGRPGSPRCPHRAAQRTRSASLGAAKMAPCSCRVKCTGGMHCECGVKERREGGTPNGRSNGSSPSGGRRGPRCECRWRRPGRGWRRKGSLLQLPTHFSPCHHLLRGQAQGRIGLTVSASVMSAIDN